jgi:ABC-2 type transport system ATP-binding protein
VISTSKLSKTFKVPRRNGKWFRRSYEQKQALSEIDLQIQPGELVGLVGDNGAGKTTLVKLLSGIIHPTSGTASVMGYTPWEREYEFRKQISVVMGQKAQLWWDLPAEDSFNLLKNIYRINETDYQSRLGELLEILNLQKLLSTPLRQLSLGERMKMELVACLLHQPKVIYLDEPTIGLDNQSQKAIRKFLKEYCAIHKPIVILTSHYMDDIEQLAKRVLLLQGGKLVYDGELNYLINTHATEKHVTVSLAQSITADDLNDLMAKLRARLILSEGNLLKLSCARNEVMSVSAQLMQSISIEDLKVEEIELASIIHGVFSGKKNAQ